MTASDLPSDSEPAYDAEGDAYQALFRAARHYGSSPDDRDGTTILLLHYAIRLCVERHGLAPAAGMCLSALGMLR